VPLDGSHDGPHTTKIAHDVVYYGCLYRCDDPQELSNGIVTDFRYSLLAWHHFKLYVKVVFLLGLLSRINTVLLTYQMPPTKREQLCGCFAFYSPPTAYVFSQFVCDCVRVCVDFLFNPFCDILMTKRTIGQARKQQ
jgi:hypothetical protein